MVERHSDNERQRVKFSFSRESGLSLEGVGLFGTIVIGLVVLVLAIVAAIVSFGPLG